MELTKEIYNKNYELLLAISFNFVRNIDIAKDIVQDTFINYYKSEKEVVGDPRYILIKITKNLCIDYFRKEKKSREALKEYTCDQYQSTNQYIDENTLLALIKEKIDLLSEKQKEVFILKQNCFSYKQIANILGLTVHISRMSYSGAINSLKKSLENNALYKEFINNKNKNILNSEYRLGKIIYDKKTGNRIKSIREAADLIGINKGTLRGRLIKNTHPRFRYSN